jgi:hypothetical protein
LSASVLTATNKGPLADEPPVPPDRVIDRARLSRFGERAADRLNEAQMQFGVSQDECSVLIARQHPECGMWRKC